MLLCVAFGNTHSARAENNLFSIAAVVNDAVITRYDVENRIRFIKATAGIGGTVESLYPRVIRSIIDEQLQIQEAQRNNINVEQSEIAEAIATLEKEKNRPAGSLKAFLQSKNVDIATLESQVRAQIGWSKLLQRQVVPELRVSDAEIEREMEHDSQQKRQVKEVKLASIILPVKRKEEDAAMHELGIKAVDMLQSGVELGKVAQQLKIPGKAIIPPTWVPLKQLSPNIGKAVSTMETGDISAPLPTPIGYQIILLKENRVSDHSAHAEVVFKEINLNLDADAQKAEVDILMNIAWGIRKHSGNCGVKTIAGSADLDELNFDVNHVRTNLSELSPQILPLVRGLKVGEVSEPFATPDGIKLLKLCEKTDNLATEKPDTEPFMRKLKEEKFKMNALKYMRDLRRDAFIDIRV